ncbi:MAG: phosphatase PAP2 family protein [Gammaproteobacteria bacterium]|nr:phosphatase PAP2 family protein [Gammaproteobacteria bacterium]
MSANVVADESSSLDLEYDVSQDTSLVYERPTLTGWMTRAPDNLKAFGRELIDKDNLDELGIIAASTAVLIRYDEDILLASQRLGRKAGLISDTKTGREISYVFKTDVKGIDLPIYYPANTNSALYYIGDGYTQLAISTGMVSYGLWANDVRALSTVSQNVESLFLTGIVVQILKRSTGREAPFVRDGEGGKWRFFPSMDEYNYNTPNYDAFPSGHVATVVASTEVFAANYPEYGLIRPTGYILSGLLAFGMLNNGVHWAGDYPVGIAIGYTSAKIVTSRTIKRKKRIKSENLNSNVPSWHVMPAVLDDSPGVALHYVF